MTGMGSPTPAEQQDERAILAVDLVVATPEEVLLIQRTTQPGKPFAGCWALPGGKWHQRERLQEALRREVAEETGLNVSRVPLELIGIFDDPDRDPRGRVVSFAYLLWMPNTHNLYPQAGSDAAAIQWWPINALPPLAFDHAAIIDQALRLPH